MASTASTISTRQWALLLDYKIITNSGVGGGGKGLCMWVRINTISTHDNSYAAFLHKGGSSTCTVFTQCTWLINYLLHVL